MCGIFGILNNNQSDNIVSDCFLKGKKRGPEMSVLTNINENTIFGFHRLAINGLNAGANQPLTVEQCILICNGEIYNYKELYKESGCTATTESDCEIIIHLYLKYGIQQTLHVLDGEFAFALYDTKQNKLFLARDPYGVRPLYLFHDIHTFNNTIGFASELKCLNNLQKPYDKTHSPVSHFKPGTYSEYTYKDYWKLYLQNISYNMPSLFQNTDINYSENLCKYLNLAVKKRVENTDRPVACLLSGGLDSSLVAALACKYYKGTLETYSIGLEGSEDLKYSQIVADHIGSKHTQIVVSSEEFFDVIPEVIKSIESYDTTTVRASVGNWLIGKYIREHSEAKVILNGDGADELMGGYMYMHFAPDSIEFDKECRRLLEDIHMFDVLRSDKCISSHGLEPRTPMLDRSFVMYYLSIPREERCKGVMEKFLIRKAFDVYEPVLLPQEVLWRTKEAFSDGVSSKEKSWYLITQEYITNIINDETFDKWAYSVVYSYNNPITEEQKYYRYIFENYYRDTGKVVPYFWMPKYVEAKDASARTLKNYK